MGLGQVGRTFLKYRFLGPRPAGPTPLLSGVGTFCLGKYISFAFIFVVFYIVLMGHILPLGRVLSPLLPVILQKEERQVGCMQRALLSLEAWVAMGRGSDGDMALESGVVEGSTSSAFAGELARLPDQK